MDMEGFLVRYRKWNIGGDNDSQADDDDDETSMLEEEAIKLAAAEREAPLKSGDDEKDPPQIWRQCDHGYGAG